MQKETDILTPVEGEDNPADRTMSKNNSENKGDIPAENQNTSTDRENKSTEASDIALVDADFEELIKGPYKDAFAKKVQGIINKRFKEQKIAENKAANQSQGDDKAPDFENTPNGSESAVKKEKSTYDDLILAGVDPDTAYRVLHLDEIMDSSMRYGAELAAKQLTDSIRSKAARPHESALTGKGYSAKLSASSLTPERRRELAKKALMGEQIGF